MSIIQIFKNKDNDTIVTELVQKEDTYPSRKTCKDYDLNPYHFKLLGRASIQNDFKHSIHYNEGVLIERNLFEKIQNYLKFIDAPYQLISK